MLLTHGTQLIRRHPVLHAGGNQVTHLTPETIELHHLQIDVLGPKVDCGFIGQISTDNFGQDAVLLATAD